MLCTSHNSRCNRPIHIPCAPHKLYSALDLIPLTRAYTANACLLTYLLRYDKRPPTPHVRRFSISESSSSRRKTLSSLNSGAACKTEDNEKEANFIKTTFSDKTALAIYACNKSWTSNFLPYFTLEKNTVTEFNVTLDQDLVIRVCYSTGVCGREVFQIWLL